MTISKCKISNIFNTRILQRTLEVRKNFEIFALFGLISEIAENLNPPSWLFDDPTSRKLFVNEIKMGRTLKEFQLMGVFSTTFVIILWVNFLTFYLYPYRYAYEKKNRVELIDFVTRSRGH